ncbi:RNA-dependent RNA polymerase 1, partial [Stegodyphus mimosarum]
MAGSSLKFVILFRKTTINEDDVKRNAMEFFTEFHRKENISYDINILESRNIDVDQVYKAKLCEMEVHIKYLGINKHFDPGVYFTKISKEWCNKDKNKLSTLWLRLTNHTVLKNKGKQSHCDVDIKEIAFGTFPSMQHFMQQYHYETKTNDREIMATFLHSQRNFIVYTCLNHVNGCKFKGLTNKFYVQYKSISRVVINDVPNREIVQLFFQLQHIPLVYREKKSKDGDEDEMHSGEKAIFLASDQEYQERRWERTLRFGCRCSKSNCTLYRIGQCLVFKIVISRKHRASGIIERLIQRCSASTHFYYAAIETVVPKVRYKDFPKFPVEKGNFSLNRNWVSDVEFICQFAWKVLTEKSNEVRDQIILMDEIENHLVQADHWELVKKSLKKYYKENVEALVNALHHISEMIDRNDIFTFQDALRVLFEYYQHNSNKVELPEGMCLMRRMIICPSRIICLPPSEHFDNRVIREFGAENMLRVSIQDDNFSKLTFAVQYHTEKRYFLDEVAAKILKEGLWIGPRQYVVLASSNSQLREHGLYMYAADHKGNTANSIRTWMGDFSHIKSVAKYMARMGQCFSTSEEAVQIELSDENIVSLNDKKSADGKYTFSDGVGMISKDLAEEVRKALHERVPLSLFDAEPYQPTAFQIRFKGCKGMIAESPSLTGRMLGIRPSMEKFQCDSSNLLEIVKISAPRAMFLNRPLITILEQLGIESNVFLKLQKAMIFDLTNSLIYEKKACSTLSNFTSLDYPYRKLLKAGICVTEEPFFRSLLLSVYKTAIDQLRSKARIAVPPESGRNMLGVIDETGTLEYGEVFVQYSKEVGNIASDTKILEGTVVVTKNPCMHPGDVRKLKAIDVPRLHHIKDCIVFPAKGKRPHPDEMAGSDLDGDEYVVIWYDDLIFQRENCDAMEYPPNEELTKDGQITVSDMINFLCLYIQNDNIGPLASAHLAWADFHEEGIFSKVCMSIAKKYPLALDFAKSGTTCYLTPKERPKHYPDFMEKGTSNNSYKSRKALGLLYRVTRNLEACISRIDVLKQPIILDSKLEYPGWKKYEQSAECLRREYVHRVKNILKKYGLQNETEVLSGYISKVNDFNQNRYEKANVISLSKSYLLDTIKRFRLKFMKAYDEECLLRKSGNSLEDIKYQMASAWYMVTYCNSDKSVLSFPWIVSDVLCEVREKVRGIISVPKSSFIQSSDKILFEQLSDFAMQNLDTCHCTSILYSTVKEWLAKSSLNLKMSTDSDAFCYGCFQRILQYFEEKTKKKCCSLKGEHCCCRTSCSPLKLILKFMKFYASEVCTELGNCEAVLRTRKKCEGFRELNLQSVALQTYASLAVTRDCSYLGLINSSSSVFEDDGSYEEGDPIRVPVTTEFESIIADHMDELRILLKSVSGVREIFISGDKDRQQNWYILVHSIGKAWQRWNLEELIMDPKMIGFIKSRLENAHFSNT